MKKHEAFPSNYFRAVDVTDPVTLTIASIRSETFENDGKTKTQRVLGFEEDQRELVLNDTRWDDTATALGQDPTTADDDTWAGGVIELYKGRTRFGRDTVDCTAVRKPTGAPKSSVPF